MKKRAIVWFRNDLRVEDNETLYRAIKHHDEIIPIYIFNNEHFRSHDLGFKKTGSLRVQFLLESLSDLKQSLSDIGGNLFIHQGQPEKIILEFAQKYDAQMVYVSKEVGTEEQKESAAVEKALLKNSIAYEEVWQKTLYHEEDIPWPINRLPDIFTQFRKETEKLVEIRPTYPSPNHISVPKELEANALPTISDLGYEKREQDPRTAIRFIGGERAGKARLHEYLWDKNLLKDYKNTRNGLIGADYSSKLSAWLAVGALSPRTVYEEVKKYEKERVKNSSTYWLIFELIWRDYFTFVAKRYGAKIFRIGGIKNDPMKLSKHQKYFDKWKDGETGVPFIDANMRELKLTGFMSNRGRQNVASFLVKDLKIDWTWGAAWFEHCLVDYDVASNWGNWNYVAGVGNDPRENRYFNIISQADRYDPNGDYVRLWLEELSEIDGKAVHCPGVRTNGQIPITLGVDYPNALVNFKKWI
ncbi:MAG: DASH family cryptochrome [Cyclobacteriaceae bacterium]|nr:DASH family cryptochrome [Cyclobacteriaceae bacterium]MCH8515615.1 DASH family cryptochrome [Cyclobacteriaceae bacterium]